MNILVTGGAGYLGSVLVPKLLVRGHKVRVVDIGYFGLSQLRNLRPSIEIIREDLRRIQTDPQLLDQILKDIDCVIHLAAISNDPSADLHPELTDEINYKTTICLAEAVKARGIRFLFSSSCSVYGEAEGLLTEEGKVNPLTAYAISKVRSDQALTEMADNSWKPVILRNGTLFGFSPKMRFDLVVNIFSLYSSLYNEIRIFGTGLQWRPFLHVADCARAFLFFAEKQDLKHICYNISHQNWKVVDIAKVFQQLNPLLKVTHVASEDLDARDYRVSNSRMSEEGFVTKTDIDSGAEQIMEAIVTGLIPDPESIYYRNAKWLKELTQIGSRDHSKVVDLLEQFSSVRQL